MSDLKIELPDRMFEPAAFMHVDGTWDAGELVAGPDTYRFEGPVSWSADITNTGDAFLIAGTAKADAVVGCARCLEDARYTLCGEIEGYLLTGEESQAPEDMDDDEFDVLGSDRVLDMEPHLAAALLMEVPLIPLCDEDCKGLCPTCGANLNEGPCGCDDRKVDDMNPFSVLAGYRFDE